MQGLWLILAGYIVIFLVALYFEIKEIKKDKGARIAKKRLEEDKRR